MISKLSSHLGPASIFSGDLSAPSLVLYLDAGNPLSYSPSGFTVSGGGTQHILNNWPSQPSEWNVYGPSYLQGGDFQDLGTPSAGWYIVDDNGNTFQVLSGPASGYPFGDTPYYNGQGWFFKMSDAFSISASNSTVTFYETQPTVTPIYGGSTWYDLTNLNNDITLSNTTFSPTYSNLTNFEGCFEFNGSSSFGSLITGTAIPLMDSHYTIESWFQANSYETGENGGIVGWGNYGSMAEVNALRQSGLGFINYWWGTDLMATQATASTNHWYHVVTTYDGVNRKIYLNGELLNSDTPGLSHSVPSFSNLKIGVTADYLDEYFNGRIAGIKIWNKNLNSTQILNSFNISKYKFGYDFGSMTFNDTQSAYLLSSSNDYAFGTNDFTIEAFFKSTATSSHSFGGVISLRDNGSYNTNGVAINLSNANTAEPNIEFGAGGNFITYTASNNQWYHVAISRTGGTSSFFVNGDLFNQVADTNNYGNTDLTIGRYYTNHNDHYLNGIVSNVRVLNGTGLYTETFSIPSTPLSGTYSDTKLLITSQEIEPTKDLTGLHTVTSSNIGWTSSLPSFYVTENLICYLDNYTGGSTWYDLSGNGNNVTLYNGYSYNATNGGVIRFDGAGTHGSPTTSSRGEINLDLTSTPCTIMYGTRYLQNTSGYEPSGRSLGGRYNNWLLGTWANSVNQFFIDNGGWVNGGTPDLSDMDWHIYTGTVNGPVKFWNNGTKLVEGAPNGDGPNGVVLGSDFLGESSNCDISFVLIYDRVLSDSEIELNFEHFRGRLGL